MMLSIKPETRNPKPQTLIPTQTAMASLVIILLLGAFSRLFFLSANPPGWLQDSYMQDAAWWANSSKNMHFYGDYFVDRYGSGFLMAPAYAWGVRVVYALGGIGLFQMRLLSALCGFLSILVCSIIQCFQYFHL